MKKPKKIAVLCSDLHLSLTQPACRADKNWMNTQAHYLTQLEEIADGCPILCAGDIFDKWNTPAELVTWTIRHLPPNFYAIPGQHDLPDHSIDQIHRSGYGVLQEVRAIYNTDDLRSNAMYLYDFPYGSELKPLVHKEEGEIHVALVHRYIWLDRSNCYAGASEEQNVLSYKSIFGTYDVVVIGDNHKRWRVHRENTVIYNCGCFIRRKSDEILYTPVVGILYENGSVGVKLLDTSVDKFHENAREREAAVMDMKEFIDALEGLGEHGLNFREAVQRYIDKNSVPDKTKQIILAALEPQG